MYLVARPNVGQSNTWLSINHSLSSPRLYAKVEHLPHDNEVEGLNPAGHRAFFLLPSFLL